MTKAFQTKQPCVISSDALHLLTATAGAVLCLPLDGYERRLVTEAIAQAKQAMCMAAGIAPHDLPPGWAQDAYEEVTCPM